MAEQDQKTHAPTDQKLEDARKKGDVPSAAEVRHAVMFVAMLALMLGMGSWTVTRMSVLLTGLWSQAGTMRIGAGGNSDFAAGLMSALAGIMLPPLLMLLGFALLTMFAQGRPNFSTTRLKIKWDRLSPAAGLKRLFGVRALVEFAKTLAKLLLVLIVVAITLYPHRGAFDTLIGASPQTIGATAVALIVDMLKAAAMLVIIIAGADFVYQRRSYMKRMMMSFQEIKDEHKKNEGDPKIKAKIRAIAMQRAQRRMMAAVPTASVIITNPTHYAVALRYDHGGMVAPVVVAKGVDAVAMKIREVANGANVPIVESPPLARALFASVEIDHPIKTEHYAAVAEIISYVLRLTKR
ncbi:flagellar biosynthesis protein FlhB [Sphingobium sp. B2]|uniref:flagellar biosynthesis protein FlhB n=1 Tax=Sphingobium sp. B2 TaxID=2583228 RepID=UPI0011A8F2B2|nr:flagellar biosynthesis protein FlhB [Sphingobium sp. B2]